MCLYLVTPVIYSLCDVATLHLNFSFEKKVHPGHPAFSFFSSYFPLYWADLGYKKVGAFISSEDPFLYCRGILHIYLSGSNCFPLLDGYTLKKKKIKAERDLEDHQSNLSFTDEDRVQIRMSHDLSKIPWPTSDSLEKTMLGAKKETGHLITMAFHCHCMGVCLPICLAHLSTVWSFSLESSWTYMALV